MVEDTRLLFPTEIGEALEQSSALLLAYIDHLHRQRSEASHRFDRCEMLEQEVAPEAGLKPKIQELRAPGRRGAGRTLDRSTLYSVQRIGRLSRLPEMQFEAARSLREPGRDERQPDEIATTRLTIATSLVAAPMLQQAVA